MMRTSDPGDPDVQVRRQALLRRDGEVFRLDPSRPSPFPHSGHPELLATREGLVLNIATTGTQWTADGGESWHELPLRSPSYPVALQDADGVVRIFGHRGFDDDFGERDQAIEMTSFRMQLRR